MGSGSALAVVLTVGLIVDPAEIVPFYHPLETFSFGSTGSRDQVSFVEDFVYGDDFTEGFFNNIEITELHYPPFGSCAGFCRNGHEVAVECF